MDTQKNTDPKYQVAIIGAGFAGLGAAIKLKQSGRQSFIVLEQADEPGGTWRDNVYPGCACDIPSFLYSYSFELNPDWKQIFSAQPDILKYIKKCVSIYDLEPHIQYGSEVTEAQFEENHAYWTLKLKNSRTITARTIIAALGPLNQIVLPDIEGRDQFVGQAFHTNNWEQGLDLNGKNVAIIGTGASAIQVVPAIAPKVNQLTVFQRTAPWITPRPNTSISPFFQKLFRWVPPFQRLLREFIYWFLEYRGKSFWGNMRVRSSIKKQCLKHIRSSISDPQLRKAVTPDYQPGCKRILVSNDYYPSLERQNVQLVTHGIENIKPNGIVTKDGTFHAVEIIIYATGFQAAEFMRAMEITGLNGQKLDKVWKQKGQQAFKGTTIHGFPNLMFMVGPNTGLGHNSIIHIIESQLNYVMEYLDLLEKGPENSYLNVQAAVQQAYNESIQQRLQKTVWATGCQSWYLDSAGRNTTLWPGSTVAFRKETQHINPEHYACITVDSQQSVFTS